MRAFQANEMYFLQRGRVQIRCLKVEMKEVTLFLARIFVMSRPCLRSRLEHAHAVSTGQPKEAIRNDNKSRPGDCARRAGSCHILWRGMTAPSVAATRFCTVAGSLGSLDFMMIPGTGAAAG